MKDRINALKKINLSIGEQRLLKLSEHLLCGKLGHKIFDFSQYNNINKPECGTAGCGLGEMPILEPLHWKFDEEGYPVLIRFKTVRSRVMATSTESSMQWFDISEVESDHLFQPERQRCREYGGIFLPESAIKEEVAENIICFLEKCKQ